MYPRASLRYQEGVLIPLAIFILAGLSVLAIAIVRMSNQSSYSSYREAISAQTFYAAESAAQYALNQLMFPNAQRSVADAQCVSINGDTVSLLRCTATLSCSVTVNSDNTTSFYTIQADTVCGSGELQANRIIQTSVFLP